MRLSVDPESCGALTADGTIRCLVDVRYQPATPSRDSSVAIALANDLVNELTTALLTHLGRTTVEDGAATTTTDTNTDHTATAQLNAVQLRRNRMVVCFDLFLDTCKPEVRRQIHDSVARPIHTIVKSGDSYRMIRHQGLDKRVAQRYAELQSVDKGPRPYFTDSRNPPFYVDGIRVDDTSSLFET
jgi:hypothetical protein